MTAGNNTPKRVTHACPPTEKTVTLVLNTRQYAVLRLAWECAEGLDELYDEIAALPEVAQHPDYYPVPETLISNLKQEVDDIMERDVMWVDRLRSAREGLTRKWMAETSPPGEVVTQEAVFQKFDEVNAPKHLQILRHPFIDQYWFYEYRRDNRTMKSPTFSARDMWLVAAGHEDHARNVGSRNRGSRQAAVARCEAPAGTRSLACSSKHRPRKAAEATANAPRTWSGGILNRNVKLRLMHNADIA